MKNITLELVDDDATITKLINEAIAKEANDKINKKVDRNRSRVEQKIAEMVDKWIKSSPEVQDLRAFPTQGSLPAELGLTPRQGPKVVDEIIEAIAKSIKIKITKFDKFFKGSLEILIQPIDYANLVNLPNATLKHPEQLRWLEWMLIKGDAPIILGYQYEPMRGGRSTAGVMIEAAGFWRVPPEYAGVPENNFITRAMANKEKDLEELLKGLLQ